MVGYLMTKLKKVSFQLSVRGEIATILKKVNFDSNKLNRGEKAELKMLITLLDLSEHAV